MKRFATLFILGLLMAGPALAQPNRVGQDVMWARDIGSASIAVDGTLNEPVWAQAETYRIQWNDDDRAFPGDGRWFRQNPFGLTDPPDPVDATVYFLRKGNDLYLGFEVEDRSIGGTRSLFVHDAVWMSMIDRQDRPEDFSDRRNFFSGTVRQEMMYGWFHPNAADTTDAGTPPVNIGPRAWSTDFGLTFGDSSDATPRSPEAWEYAATWNGTTNQDLDGRGLFQADNGYTMEMRIRLDSLGWDLTQPMSRMPMSITVMDQDYNWPQDEARYNVNQAWWQNLWLNNYNEGVAFIAGDPSVTVSSGAAPAYTEPEFTVPSGANVPEPTIDGQLDEPVWGLVEPQFRIQYQASGEFLDENLPGVLAPNYTFYFAPGSNPILDPTIGNISMFYRGSKLYIGLDTDDQAVNGSEPENTRDGFRLQIRSRDSTQTGFQGVASHLRMDFSVDSTGSARMTSVSPEIMAANAVEAAVFLKDGSTAADPTDIDAGYQMEVALDLAAIGYDDLSNGGQIYIALTYFDGDSLEDDAQSYGTRTWIIGERTNGGSLYGFLDPNALIVTADETGPNGEEVLRALGNAPNPFSAATDVRFRLATASAVTVEVYDVLGRLVQSVDAGLHLAGDRAVTIDASSLSTGSYVYRVRLDDGTSVSGQMMVVR